MDLTKTFPLGLIPAVHTPFDAHGDLNLAVVEKQFAHLSSQQVAGAFVAGTTGECHSMTTDEREKLTRRWCEVARGSSFRVMVHIGHNCQRDASRLAAHAAQCGAASIASTAPFYFKPESVSELIDFLAPVAGSAASLPFYFYDIPAFTGVRLDMSQFLEQGKQAMPNLAGLKFTNNDLMLMQECVQLNGGAFSVLHGFDETLLAGVALGARGAVGNTYNIAARHYQRLLKCWAEGDMLEARRLQAHSVRLIRSLQSFGFQAAAKAAAEFVGMDCGPPRSPLKPLMPAAKSALFRELESLLER